MGFVNSKSIIKNIMLIIGIIFTIIFSILVLNDLQVGTIYSMDSNVIIFYDNFLNNWNST